MNTERPILFSGGMVLAILEGRKTQTRRVVKENVVLLPSGDGAPFLVECPYGVPGDRLWVRETWASGYQDGAWGTIYGADSAFALGRHRHEKGPHFHAKEVGPHVRWRPSIHMPRWACRIALEITDVRVQRLQEISEDDAWEEGPSDCMGPLDINGRLLFRDLWDSINAKKYPWSSNPWVWALSFRRLP